jgi:hypothetical protein
MLSLCASSALGYAPMMAMQARASRVSAPVMAVSDMAGVSTEVGGKVWDPLNLSANMDEANLNLIRAAELKHCRVAMLATVGWLWTATGTHFNGMLSLHPAVSFADATAAPNPILAAAMVPGAGIWQMVLAIGALEITWENKYPSSECAGNFGVPAVTQDPAKLRMLEDAELKNGRLAMIGIISFACAVAIPGSVPLYPF